MNIWKHQAQALFGSHWKAIVASISGANKRTVARWAAGLHDSPRKREVEKKIDETYKIWRGDE